MLHTWVPGMTICMSVLNNMTVDPQMGMPQPGKNVPYKLYLDAATMLIEAVKNGWVLTEDNIDEGRNENIRVDDVVEEDVAEEDVSKVRCPPRPMDCQELLSCGYIQSGVYRIWPRSRVNTWGEGGFEVFCDMQTDGGGWTVIQRRDDFGTSSDFFFKGWQSYKFGFGDLNYDFWLGNDKIFALSNQRRTVLRFDLLDFDGDDGYATYDDFYIDDEYQNYRLHIGDYRGVIGDSFKGHNLCRFSTRDRDNDNSYRQNCALLYKGGWWYNNCHTVNLNGLYLKGNHDTYADGVNWYGWKGFKYSVKRTEMKIRSANFMQRTKIADELVVEKLQLTPGPL